MAVELEKLRAVFGYEAGAWQTASGLYLDALADLPPDLLSEAVAETIRMAGPDDHFPRPGVLRGLVRERLEHRRQQAKLEHRSPDDEWPNWLREIWGDRPEGPLKRRAVLDEHERRRHGPVWRDPLPAQVGDFSTVHQALGVAATPSYEDAEALRRGRVELGLED